MKIATLEQGEYRRKLWSIDAKNKLVMIMLQVGSLIWLFIFCYFLGILANIIRPDWHSWQKVVHDIFFLNNNWLTVAILIVGLVFFIWLHEMIHGVFFWLFTHDKPKITFSILFASCTTPGWYLPPSKYLIITLAPFILINIIGLIILRIIFWAWIPYLMYMLAFTGAGAIGDIFVANKVFAYSRKYDVVITDWGSGCAVYAK